MSELVSKVAGSKYVSRIDLKSAYFQIYLSTEGRKYTALDTHTGKFSYLRMPIGLTRAPNTCERMVIIMLRGTHRVAGSLMDHILVYSKDFESHLKHIEDVLGRIKQAGLTVNAEKCTFATNSLRLFGHWLENGTISPDSEKVKVVSEWPIPKTKSLLKSFLGLCGFFS